MFNKPLFINFWNSVIFLFWVLMTFVGLTSPASAEGSRELVANGGYRPYLELDPNSKTANIVLRAIIKVFAKEGEVVNLGGSIHDSLNDPTQDIIYRSPTGIEGSCDVLKTGFGYIDTVEKETIGPFPNQGGYDPCTFTATEEGIYEIEFYMSKSAIENTNPRQKTATADFLKKERQGNSIAAWDITVLNENGEEQKGRAFTNFLPLRMGGKKPFLNSEFFVLSNTGYLYKTQLNGAKPLNFLFFSNNKGFQNENGQPLFQSVKEQEIGKNVFVHAPNALDTDTDVTNKIFFNHPDEDDLPTEAALPGGNSTWLLLPPIPLPEVTDFKFTGNEGTVGQMGANPLSGIFSFNSSMVGHYFLSIDINNNTIYGDGKDRMLKGQVVEGNNTIAWNGLDGEDQVLAAQNLPFNATLNLIDDVHFPFFDLENNLKGFVITRLNCELPPCVEDSTVYYNNQGLTGGTPPNPLSALNGIDSKLERNGIIGVQEFADDFGNAKVLDTWTMLSPPIELEGGIQIKQADLTLSKTHTTELPPIPGGIIQYIITVRNDGPSDVRGIQIQDNLPATITEPLWTCKISDSLKPEPAIQNRCTSGSVSGNIDTTIDLQSGATATFKLDATISNTAAVGDTVTNSVTITRPNDVTNPQGSTGDVKTETASHSFTIAPPANKVPTANDLSATTDNETTVRLPALEATDTDGTIASYIVFNLPASTQGELYIGDPIASGTLITEGQSLTLEQISTLFFKPHVSFSGDTTFNYTANDDVGATSNTAIVTISVTIPPNEPPVADSKTVDSTSNDMAVRLPSLSATDQDPDGTIEAYIMKSLPAAAEGVLYLGDPAAGGIPIVPGQKLSPNEVANLYFEPNPNFIGNASFTYSALDNRGTESETATVTLPVTAANKPPTAKDKTASETPNNVTVQMPALDASDDGTVVSYQITTLPPESAGLLYVGDPNKGGRKIIANETLTPIEAIELFFKPNTDFRGDTNFTYTATDNHGAVSNQATVTIPITQPPNNPPIANKNSSNTDPGVPVTIAILSDDSDPDDNLDPSNLFIAEPPSQGTVEIQSDGNVIYTPKADFTDGTDTFTYTVCDTGTPILCDTAEVSVAVPLGQQPPTADNKTASATLNNTTAKLPSLSASDEDGSIEFYTIETLPLSKQGVLYLGDPASGGVPITPGQTLTPAQIDNLFFEPNPNFIGDASFTYSATDDLGETSSPALVSIPVEAAPNSRPTVHDDSASTAPNSPVTLPLLNNDSDPEGSLDKGSLKITEPPANGKVTINEDASVTYTPNKGFEGTDSFDYKVCDTGLPSQCETAEVTLTVTTDNKPPVADSKTTPATPNNIAVPIPALSATDTDGTVTSYTIVSLPLPSQGELFFGNATVGLTPLQAGQQFTPAQVSDLVFQPNETFTGNASFTYRATDDQEAESNEALVTIPVQAGTENQAPTLLDDQISTDPGSSVTFAPLNNDSDPESELDPDSLEIATPPSKGTVSVNDDGTISYTPNADFTSGSDTFTYQICDVGSPQECEIASVTVTVPIGDNKPPLAENITASTTTNDQTVSLPALSATDEDGTVASYTIDSLPKSSQGRLFLGNPTAGGTALTAAQVLTPAQISQIFFQPESDFIGKASFSYTATDDQGAISSPALVTIPVTAPENTPPNVNEVNADTAQDTPVTIGILDNDSDPNNNLDESSLSITTQPENGTVTLNPDGTVTFTPNPGFFGTDSFSYQVCDSGTPPLCDIATVNLEVTPSSLPPFDLSLRITGNGSAVSAPIGIDCNPTNDPCTTSFAGGTEVLLTPTPDEGWSFQGWRGHCNDEGQVTMDTVKQCQVVFVPADLITVTLNVARSGPGSILSTPTGIDCGTDCVNDYDVNTQVALKATAEPGAVFVEWTDDCNGTNHTFQVTMETDKRCQASFAPDKDGDGVADSIEDGAPNNGDGNGDGILDSQQDHVASVLGPDGNYITLEEKNECTINNLRLTEQEVPADGDNYLPAPLDLDFQCEEADVIAYYHGKSDLCETEPAYRQYVPTTPGNVSTTQWQDLPVDCETANIAGQNVPTVNFHLSDGQLGDLTSDDGRILNTSGRVGAPTQVQFSLPNYTVDESAHIATITVNRTGSCESPVTVNYASQANTATPDTDYTDVSGTITWQINDCDDKTFTIPIQDDLLEEGNETLDLFLSNPSGRIRQSLVNDGITIVRPEAVLTILDDESKSTGSCVDTSACQVCCSSGCQPLSSGLKIKSLSTTIRVGETVNITLADGTGELLIKEIPNRAFVALDEWKPLNNGAGEITLTGISEGETEMVVTDSAAPLQTVTIYITVIPDPQEGFGFKAIQTTILVGQRLDLTVAGGQGELAISELPNPSIVLLEAWAPLGDTGAAQFALIGKSVGESKAVILDRSTPAQKTTINITVVQNANQIGVGPNGTNGVGSNGTNIGQPDGPDSPNGNVQSCVNAREIDAQGNSLETSQACFLNTLRIAEARQPNHRRLTFTEAQTLNLAETVNIDPAHVGQAADILMLAVYNTVLAGDSYYVRDEQTWSLWDKQLSSLSSTQFYPQLPAQIEVFIYDDDLSLSPGEFKVFVGYRLEDGTIIYNGNEPLHFFVSNSSSFEFQTDSTKTLNLHDNEIKATTIFEPYVYNFTHKQGNYLTFEYDIGLNVSTFVKFDPRHIGQPADILMVADYEGSIAKRTYTRTGPTWQIWDQRLESLAPVQHYHQLPASLEIPIYLGLLTEVPGHFTVYAGYRLINDNTLVFNGFMPIKLTVANGYGVDNTGQWIPTIARFISWAYQFDGHGNPFKTPLTKPVGLATTIFVDPEHVGQTAELLMVATRHALGTQTDNPQTQPQIWRAWDVQAIVLDTTLDKVTLEPVIKNIPLFAEQIQNEPGDYVIYVGYKLENGDIIYNGGETLRLSVENLTKKSAPK